MSSRVDNESGKNYDFICRIFNSSSKHYYVSNYHSFAKRYERGVDERTLQLFSCKQDKYELVHCIIYVLRLCMSIKTMSFRVFLQKNWKSNIIEKVWVAKNLL